MKILQLLGARVLIQPMPDQTISSGVVIPQSITQRHPMGIIRMIGTGNGDRQLTAQMAELQVGQLVRTDLSFGAIEIDVDGTACRIHSVCDVQLIL